MKVATTDLNIPVVPQEGRNAAAIRENLKRIKLPPGFRIDLFAVVPDARHMAVAPSTNMLFVGTRKTTVWAVTDRNSDGVADEVKSFAPSLKFTNPNGVCWTKDGFLVVAEHNRVLNFPAAEFFYEGPDVAVIEVVGQGKLVRRRRRATTTARAPAASTTDGNALRHARPALQRAAADKVAMYEQLGIGGMIKMNAFDGSKREVVARGVRNSVGMDINPKDKTVWFTDNQTDGMGDDTPPGELNRITKSGGEHFGYPFIHGNNVQIAGTAAAPDLKGMAPPAQRDQAADRVPGAPGAARHDLLQRQDVPGAVPGRHLRRPRTARGTAPRRAAGCQLRARSRPTARPTQEHGVRRRLADGETGIYRGRPVDVAVMKDGSLLVSTTTPARSTASRQRTVRAGDPHDAAGRRLRWPAGGPAACRGGRQKAQTAGLRRLPRPQRRGRGARDAQPRRRARGLPRPPAACLPAAASASTR